MSFSTGHRPDHPEVVRRRVPLHLHPQARVILAPALPPMQSTNRANIPTAKGGPGDLDQDGVSGCEGNAHAITGTLRLSLMGVSQGLISSSLLYLGALLMDQGIHPDGTLTTVTDTGTIPSSIQSAWQTFGASLAKDDTQYPMTRASLYQNPADDNSALVLPSIEKLYAASPYRYKGSYFISEAPGNPARLLKLILVLASKRPVTDAVPASGPEFQGYRGGVMGLLSGPVDHANSILDYEWTGNASDWQTFWTALTQADVATTNRLKPQLRLHAQNSWGETKWGETDTISGLSGDAYRASTDYLDCAEDLCAVDLEAT